MPTILVADDNSNIQKMVTLAFKGEGIDVVAVGNGEAAVKKAIEIVPDLVLADIFMPVRSGYEVCEFLKQDPRFSHIPVVLLAGAFDPFDEREAQRVGADGVLKKPFVPPDPLVALVKGLLAKNAEKLVAVSVPVQTAAVSSQNASQNSTPAISSAPFVPPPFLSSSPDPSVKEEEYPDDDLEMGTATTPMRDFSIPGASPEPARGGGADAFGSMLDTSPLGTLMSPMRKLTEPVTEEAVGEDRDIEPASAHTAFEGFSPWRASASSAGVVEEEEAPAQAIEQIEQPDQSTASPKDLMGRVWEIDPNSDKSPEETIIEPHDDISPLTHSTQYVTAVRKDASATAEALVVAAPTNEVSEPETNESSRVSDWRSTFSQAKEEAAQIVESASPSLSPWRIPGTPAETFQNNHAEEIEETHEVEGSTEVPGTSDISETPEISSSAEVEAYAEPVAEAPSFNTSASSVEGESEVHEPFAPEAESETGISTHFAQVAEPESSEDHGHQEASVSASEESVSGSDSGQTETSDWIAALPEHLSSEDTTTLARSLVEQLAPGAVESMASSFPVPTAASSDPRVVEEIVARVVERMQPQILDMITREVLRPVVEALVRRQLEQKLPE